MIVIKGKKSKPENSEQNNEIDRSRILVVDDEFHVLECISKILRLYGYRVDIANGGPEAVEKCLQQTYDIILTDFDMPGIDGIQLTAWVKQRSPQTKVLMMTGRFDINLENQAHDSGIDQLLHKPFNASELQSVISHCFTNAPQV